MTRFDVPQADGRVLTSPSPPLNQLPFTSNATTSDYTLIPFISGKKIRVYSFACKLLTTANVQVLVKDGATTIDTYVLTNRGDVGGFIAQSPVYTLSQDNPFVINLSLATTVYFTNILYEYI